MHVPSIGMRKRIILLFIFTILMTGVLVGRLVWIQFVKGEELRQKAINSRMRDVPVEARRGIIYDRKGRELAISVNADTVYAVPTEVTNPEQVARILASTLKLDYNRVLARLTKPSSFEYIKREIEEEESRAIKELGLPGIYLTQESRRFYPKGNLASHVLGIAGIDNQGLEGVEYIYDEELKGKPGSILVEYDARGKMLPQSAHQYLPPRDGNNLILTIDEVIQYVVERELDRAMLQTQAKRGIVMVMDPRTGEILALANRPDYDPNHYERYPDSARRNLAIADSFSPGSTFKPITAVSALEEGVVSASSGFYCPGAITVPGAVIGCIAAHGSLSFYETIQYSCNVSLVQMGLRLGATKFYQYLKAFNLLDPTGIDLPGEATSIVPPLGEVKPVDLAVMSFGQTLTITPLQLLTAIATIANDGVLMWPHVAREIRSPDGKVVKEFRPVAIRQVVSRESAREMVKAMHKVITGGTGKRAWVEGYNLAGKTGTAQKVVGGVVSMGIHSGVFVGFGPIEDPRLAMVVFLDEPAGSYFGGVIAAPVFAAVMRDSLRYLGIPPRVDAEVPLSPVGYPTTEKREEVTVPNVINLPVEQARGTITQAGLGMEVDGTGPLVLDQLPPPGAKMEIGRTVIVFTEGGTYIPPAEGEVMVTVPSVAGKTMREAGEILGSMGLRMNPSGTGVATSQEPSPGTKVNRGSVVKVRFSPP